MLDLTLVSDSGLSARKLWTQRSQFIHDQLLISDRDNLLQQHKLREKNHPSSEKSKHKSGKTSAFSNVEVGYLVCLYSDRDKSRARNRYLVVFTDGDWCFIKKFTGNQLRSSSYKVKRDKCYLVSKECPSNSYPQTRYNNLTDDEDDHKLYTNSSPPPPVVVPDILTTPEGGTPVQMDNTDRSEQYDYPIILATPTEDTIDCQPTSETQST